MSETVAFSLRGIPANVAAELDRIVEAHGASREAYVRQLLIDHVAQMAADSGDYVTIGFIPFTPDPEHGVECDDCQTAANDRPVFLAIDEQLRPRRLVCGDCILLE